MDEDIKKLLQQNLEYSKEIYALTKKMKRLMAWQGAMGVIYFILIVVPIILSIIYLPPVLKSLFDQYKGIIGLPAGSANPLESLFKSGAGGLDLNKIDVNNLPAGVREMIK